MMDSYFKVNKKVSESNSDDDGDNINAEIIISDNDNSNPKIPSISCHISLSTWPLGGLNSSLTISGDPKPG